MSGELIKIETKNGAEYDRILSLIKNGATFTSEEFLNFQIAYGFNDFKIMMLKLSGSTKQKEKKAGYVYFIKNKSTGLTKIGCSSNIEKRIKSLQVGSSEKLECFLRILDINYRKLEKKFHKVLNNYRIIGEWFDLRNLGHKNLRKLLKMSAN